jgi:hypothetical protein
MHHHRDDLDCGPRGLPLDRTGVTTPGTVSISMIPATIPKEQTQYISYAMLDQMKTMCIALAALRRARNGEPGCLPKLRGRGK